MSNQSQPLEVLKSFTKLGWTSFGGPVAHIGYFRKEFVENKQWLSEQQFAQLFSLCQFLPGPASSQMGFLIGLMRGGWLGALLAFVAFTFPSAVLLFMFVHLLPHLPANIADASVHGLKLVACIIVFDALWGMAKKLTNTAKTAVIAVAALSLILLLPSFYSPLIAIFLSAIVGSQLLKKQASTQSTELPFNIHKSVAVVCLLTFTVLLLLLPALNVADSALFSLFDGFYRAGALVFGGGHVVLPMLENEFVGGGFIDSETFLAGYGASQAIPGPMFAFASYIGAIFPGAPSESLAATVALIAIFLPGFLLAVGVMPFWQLLQQSSSAKAAVLGVNAAVVGVLAAALIDPILTSAIRTVADIIIVALGVFAFKKWQLSPLVVVGYCLITSLIVGVFS